MSESRKFSEASVLKIVGFVMKLLLGLAALVGFTLSLIVHSASLLGIIDLSSSLPWILSLHLGIFAVCIPLAFSARARWGQKPSFAQMRECVPSWVFVLGIGIFAYAIVNFFLFVLATGGGSPSVENGKFFLKDHHRLIREITAAEYAAFRANEVRGISGHWLPFYFMSFAYFIFGKESGDHRASPNG